MFYTRLLLCCCVLFGSSAIATAGQVQMPIRLHSGDLKSSLNRVLELHLENSDEIVRSSASLESLERTLTALQPSLIMVFLSVTKEIPLSTSQVALFLEIQKKVLAANPRCKFSVGLPINNCLSTPELLSRLQEITTKLGPDIINLVLPFNNDLVSPTALARVIEYAHHHGQIVVYKGPPNMIPDGIDGFVMKAISGEVHRDEINNFKTKHHLPIIIELSAGTFNKDEKGFLVLKHLAEGQASLGYHLAYPLILTSSGSSNENKDASFLVTLRALMTRYN